ncbi:hypothetical protein ACWC5C_22420 [Streptomyces sp. NPDC001700]
MKLAIRAGLAGVLAAAALATASPAQAEDITLPLRSAIATLPVTEEDRSGYDRDLFNHWIDADRDGCSTRSEVLLEEATVAPQVTGRAPSTAGAGTPGTTTRR